MCGSKVINNLVGAYRVVRVRLLHRANAFVWTAQTRFGERANAFPRTRKRVRNARTLYFASERYCMCVYVFIINCTQIIRVLPTVVGGDQA